MTFVSCVRRLRAIACFCVFSFASGAHAQLGDVTVIAPDGTLRGPLLGSQHACAGRIEQQNGEDVVQCAGTRNACVTVWSADVSPLDGRERGVVCANTAL